MKILKKQTSHVNTNLEENIMKKLLKIIDKENLVMGPPRSKSPDVIKKEPVVKKESPVPESNLIEATQKNLFQDNIS